MSAQLQRYELVRTIARGGMATVSEAVAHGADGFRRKVALKRIVPELAGDEAMRRMFLDEARIASELHHGNIIQIIDYGLVDDGPFLVMELIEGLSAREACSTKPPPVGVSLHMAAEIAHALDYLAKAEDASGTTLGIVHRDLSPHNVLLSWEGDVKLSDFGVAFARVRDERTEAGVVKGKRAYMPPEQAAGDDVTPASDVYALGATLCWFLTGAPPDQDVLDDIEDDEVRELVASCLAESPDARPTAADVAERAGRLAAANLERDARGAMRAWLGALEEKPSTLDDLMGMALVPDDGGGYTLSKSVAEAPEAPEASSSRGSLAIPIVAALLALASALAWWVSREPAQPIVPPEGLQIHVAPPPVMEATEPAEAPVEPIETAPTMETPRVRPTMMSGGISIDRNIQFED